MTALKPTLYTLAAITAALAVAWSISAARHETAGPQQPQMTEQQRDAIRVGMTPQQLAALMGREPTEIQLINGTEYRIWTWTGNALQAQFKGDRLTTAATHSVTLDHIPPPDGE